MAGAQVRPVLSLGPRQYWRSVKNAAPFCFSGGGRSGLGYTNEMKHAMTIERALSLSAFLVEHWISMRTTNLIRSTFATIP
jgi:hypothetical protein